MGMYQELWMPFSMDKMAMLFPEFLTRVPPLNDSSRLAWSIMEANGSERMNSYVSCGCINSDDSVKKMVS